MAKQLVHIGVAVSTVGDGLIRPEGSPPLGMVPGRSNIINLAAACGDAYKFNENIIPQTGLYGTSAFWEKHPTEYAALKVKPIALPLAMLRFRTWLKQFQGILIACSSTVDFWHLLDAFFKTGKDCPFGSTGVIDAGTVEMLRKGRVLRPRPVTDRVDPLSVARARWEAVTQGHMPQFGVPPRPRKKLRATIQDDPLARALRNVEREAQAMRQARIVPVEAQTGTHPGANNTGLREMAFRYLDQDTIRGWNDPPLPPPPMPVRDDVNYDEDPDF